MTPPTLFRVLILGSALVLISTIAQPQTKASCKFKVFKLPPSITYYSVASGVNDAGTVVGSSPSNDVSARGFIRSADAKVAYYCAPGANCTVYNSSTYFTDLNDAGVAVGVYNKPENEQDGFMLSGSTFTPLQDPDAACGTFPNGINKSNTVVGQYGDQACNAHGFQLSDGTYTTLDYPGAQNTFPTGINDSGVIVGYYYYGHGFTYQDGNWATLDYPGASGTGLTGISDAGLIVGNSNTTNPDIVTAFLYENGEFKTIAVPNTYSTSVSSISPDGLILGMTNLDNTTAGWRGFTATCH